MKILIVEDEGLIALHLEEMVAGLGHEVCAVAASAPEAIDASGRHMPDLALMDIHLARGTSGLDAARELYARYKVRCIFLSGNLDRPTRAALEPFEPIEFIGKPVLPALLRRALVKAEQAFER